MPLLWIKSWIKRFYFFGISHKCNACGSYLRKWQWHGENSAVHCLWNLVGSGRRRCLCPICHSIDRERLILQYLNKMKGTQKIDTFDVLHFAPELPVRKWFDTNNVNSYLGVDFFSTGYQYNDVSFADIQNLDFKSNSFDLIICSHVMEHVPDDTKSLLELWRVLRSNGQILLMVPYATNLKETINGSLQDSSERRLENFGQKDHLRLYGQDLTEKLLNLSFQVSTWKENKLDFRLGLNQHEEIFILKKVLR